MPVEEVFPQVMTTVGTVQILDTVVVTWAIMILLAGLSFLATRRLRDEPGPLQNAMEAIVEAVEKLVADCTQHPPQRFLPFIGTLAFFLAVANSVSILPSVGAPTRDVSTTIALATIVFFAVHYFGIRLRGLRAYAAHYLEPHWLLLPFNIIGEVSKTIALALRLFGNMISGELVVAVLLLLAGLLVPVPLQIFGLLIGLIQAYVFTLLAMVYIGAALQAGGSRQDGESS